MTVERGILYTLASLLIVAVLAIGISRHGYESELTSLRNQIAEKDRVVEVQKGVYAKLAVETDGIKKLLDSKDEQVKLLLGELKSRKAEVLTATSMAIAWKKAYEGAAEANQEVVPGTQPTEPGAVAKERVKVSFHKDFGAVVVDGHTVTDPPEAFVSVKQGKPLRVSLVVSQEKDGSWKTYATSSDENISVDIGLTAVNPKVLEQQWYEKLSLDGSLGIGSGIVAGVGVSYEVGQFDVGPAAWFSTSGQFYGANVSWHPFRRK